MASCKYAGVEPTTGDDGDIIAYEYVYACVYCTVEFVLACDSQHIYKMFMMLRKLTSRRSASAHYSRLNHCFAVRTVIFMSIKPTSY